MDLILNTTIMKWRYRLLRPTNYTHNRYGHFPRKGWRPEKREGSSRTKTRDIMGLQDTFPLSH